MKPLYPIKKHLGYPVPILDAARQFTSPRPATPYSKAFQTKNYCLIGSPYHLIRFEKYDLPFFESEELEDWQHPEGPDLEGQLWKLNQLLTREYKANYPDKYWQTLDTVRGDIWNRPSPFWKNSPGESGLSTWTSDSSDLVAIGYACLPRPHLQLLSSLPSCQVLRAHTAATGWQDHLSFRFRGGYGIATCVKDATLAREQIIQPKTDNYGGLKGHG